MKTVTKETIIKQILENNPEKARILSEIMMQFGIHCIGCGANAFETLEQGVLGHGFSKEQLNNLIKDLNAEISKKENKKEAIKFELNLTKTAIKKIKEQTKKSKEKKILRISVLAGGCSGHMYEMEMTKKQQKADKIISQEGVKIAVDNESLELLNGIEIDYVDTLQESGFAFNNPNSKKSCGCGKSFG